MASTYGDFYAARKWGFPKSEPSENIEAPQHFLPGHLDDPAFYEKGYHVEKLGDGDGFYWVGSPSGYDAAFMLTGNGVVAIDAPPALGENMVAAVESVTDEPVTHLIYSHWHSDHIGGAKAFGPNVKIIGHEMTRELLTRFPDPYRPAPTETFSTDETLEVNGARLELSYKGFDHTPGNIYIYAPEQKVLTKIDIVSPGSVAFMHADASENISGYFQAHDDILAYDFKAYVGGHSWRWGTREDVEAAREYWHDLRTFTDEALRELSTKEVLGGFLGGSGRGHVLTASENWINSMANYITEKALTKSTSDGRTWPERLAGATQFTKYHAYTVMESSRLERTHHGYQTRGDGGPWYIV
ncbi:MBL fold metallo-hydrolase [Streptomyces sp. NPDC018964]|uniref:MBL fold metallo-hydrolase n=1 Tax=unclassified Streptomyces TaxID=2593676 RepID=UPI0037ACC620